MALRPGTLVGKYRIEWLLGEGGMGAVYVATNLSTEVPVALKMMSDHLRADESAARRFLQEARAVAKLRHPGIVRVYDSDRDASGLWLAMELVEGESLASAARPARPSGEFAETGFRRPAREGGPFVQTMLQNIQRDMPKSNR